MVQLNCQNGSFVLKEMRRGLGVGHEGASPCVYARPGSVYSRTQGFGGYERDFWRGIGAASNSLPPYGARRGHPRTREEVFARLPLLGSEKLDTPGCFSS